MMKRHASIHAVLLLAVAFAAGPAAACEPRPKPYDIDQQRAKIVRIPMPVDSSFLNQEERAVINKLIAAADLMSEIYLRQVSQDNPRLRAEIAASQRPDKDKLLDMFDLHFGVWDSLAQGHPFYGDERRSAGAGFYPKDITKVEFENWIRDHPKDEQDFKSLYTVIRRDGDKLKAIPYSLHYREWLEPAAKLLNEAADITSNKSLKAFLHLRAYAFYTDDYYESELAWMDLEGTPIEVVIGPYEVYTDRLYGYKAAFEAFITLRNPEESAAVARYKKYLRDMEAHLPVDESYKNFRRGFASPIAVTDQLHGGGDNVPGVQTIAFNLPNDERVREAKGAKKVLLKNVIEAKFRLILGPMAEHILVSDQAPLLIEKYMSLGTLFHELSHSLGPGTIEKDGEETTVGAELKELYSPLEEGKADMLGVYNLLFMMEKGELPAAEKENLLATYFVGLFRSMRFGIDEAHGHGAALQYSYLKAKRAFLVDAETAHFRIDFKAMEKALEEMVRDMIMVQGDGDYAKAKAFLERWGHIDDWARTAIERLSDIPVDIQPSYPPKV
ncbi:MAG: hypothetical protein IH996_01615 [Proteobacteria bacterium]|nr:hypothetical protein [Pseudomonadota bacterium]